MSMKSKKCGVWNVACGVKAAGTRTPKAFPFRGRWRGAPEEVVFPHRLPALLLVLIFLMLRYTRFGRSLYAVGGNATSAAMMGLNVKSIKMRVHVLCSVLTSIGGICYCLNTMAGSVSQATGLEMDAISSAVIGGTLLTGGVGNVFGTFFGVLINGTISSIVKTNGKLASSWPNILTAILLFVFIVIQSIFAAVLKRGK